MNPDRRLIYVAVFAIMGLSNAVIPILPELAARYHSTFGEFASSLLFSGYFLGALATMLPFGIMADRFENLRFIGFGIILTAASGLIILFSENLWILLISRFMEGAACGAFFPAAFSTLSKCKDPGRCMGEFTFFFNAGLASGALVSGLLADTYLKGAILIFTFIASLSIIPLLPRHKELINPKAKGEKTDLLSGSLQDHFKHSFSEISGLLNRQNSAIWLSSFLLNGAIGVLIAYYPEYSLEFLTKAQLGGAISSLYICAMAASLLVGRFRIKEKVIIGIGLSFSALGALFAIKYPFLGFSSIGGGSGIAMVGFALAVARMDAYRGLAMGLFNTTVYAGLSLLPIAAGFLTGFLSFEEIFAINGFILAGALLLKD
ncbi:Multidrug resistance protein B [Methanosarcina siciliae C2J]|uniref:Multidrug resistance protein B n=1 Tax=Methanosarcina siciliae C2J TaxID=1434118 RepID=A0A0E3PRW6_9EURY|nr:MFS transporter [Methanosarcina siciliae]AKB38207.1 Multidrug resistance protein B [Methanosarcina siciliae C2J]